MDLSPKWPVRADHRLILTVANMVLKGKYVPLPDEFDRISRVFSKAGGSWERLFRGSPKEMDRLKRVIKVGFKSGFVTPSGEWSKS